MFLQIYVGRIALIAYVLGGWLLPLLHDHGAHGHTSSTLQASCGHTSTSHDALELGSSCDHSDDHHSQNDSASSGHNKASLEHKCSEGSPSIGSGPLTTFHDHGLCALCVSRSVNGQQLMLIPSSFRVVAEGFSAPPELPHCVRLLGTSAFARGPPITV